jgi:hypothetical protein
MKGKWDGSFLPPPRGGSTPKGGWGCLSTTRAYVEKNTPSVASRHLPRKTGEENAQGAPL